MACTLTLGTGSSPSLVTRPEMTEEGISRMTVSAVCPEDTVTVAGRMPPPKREARLKYPFRDAVTRYCPAARLSKEKWPSASEDAAAGSPRLPAEKVRRET